MSGEVAGLDRDWGVHFIGEIDASTVSRLSEFLLRDFSFKRIQRVLAQITVEGDIFGHPAINLNTQPTDDDSLIKLNTAPILGRVVINKSVYKEPDPLHLEALGLLAWNDKEVSVEGKYQSIMPLLKLDDVLVSAELQPDQQVKLQVDIEFRY